MSYKRYPQKPILSQKKRTEILLSHSSASYFVKRMTNALFELENMQISYKADRELQFAIVEKYKDERGKNFKKAQIAAVKGDNDAVRIRQIQKKKEAIFAELNKVWALYTGDEKDGEIIALYLRHKGAKQFLKEKFTDEEIERAVAKWKDYVQMTAGLTLTRFKERNDEYHNDAEELWKSIPQDKLSIKDE